MVVAPLRVTLLTSFNFLRLHFLKMVNSQETCNRHTDQWLLELHSQLKTRLTQTHQEGGQNGKTFLKIKPDLRELIVST